MPHQDPDELFDVVDADDRVVGQATRAVVHSERLLHRSAHVFVFNSRGELFLQQRALCKDENPGVWDSSAAGHLDAGESYPQAARRELAEELGLALGPDPSAGRLVEVGALPATPETGYEFRRLFVVTTDEPPRPDPAEVMDGRFFPLDELDRLLAGGRLAVTPAFRELYGLYRSRAARDAAAAPGPAVPASAPAPGASPAAKG